MKKQVVVALMALVAFGFGCGKSEKTYKTTEGELKVEEKSGQVTVETTTKEGKVKIAGGDSGVALPDNFPKDVPIIHGATVRMAVTQGAQMFVNLRAPGSTADAAKFYQESLKGQGWEIETAMNMGDTSMLSAKKEKRQCTVVAAKDSDGTMVQLTVSPEGS